MLDVLERKEMHFHGRTWPRKEAYDGDENRWIEIEYIDFWDFARLFVLECDGRTFVFNAPFLPIDDEYSDFFLLYEIGKRMDWQKTHLSAEIGNILPVDQLVFDETRKKYVLRECIEKILREQNAAEQPATSLQSKSK